MEKARSTFDFNEAIGKSLKTWYPKSHNLHFNPHHPLGKLAGKWGELLDDYMKSIYKPNYEFKPEDELGDIWYYLRILCYQQSYIPRDTVSYEGDNTDIIIAQCIIISGELFLGTSLEPITYTINSMFSAIVQIGERYDLTLDQITDSNWDKLKPGSERGEEWMKTRIDTDYVNIGKIGKVT